MSESISEPVIRTDAPALHFISIIPAFVGRADYLAKLIRDRRKRTGIRRYAMSFPLHPQGNDLQAKPRILAGLFRELKPMLAGEDLELGILFQSTVGHGGYWNLTPDNNLPAQRAVKADGSETIRPCPFDPVFLDYIEQAVRTVVQEKPDFTLGDDDMRMFNDTCYCPHHLAALQRKTGRLYTREELAPLIANAPAHDPLAQAFEDVQIEGMETLCRRIRKTIDSIDPAISCGCCIVGNRMDYAERELAALAGPNTRPFLRISNSYYLEEAVKNMAAVDLRTARQTVPFKPLGIDLLDESDTCPHNRFSKSARTMNLHIISGIAHGVDGGKLWLDAGAGPHPDTAEHYEAVLAKHQGQYRELHRLIGQWQPVGPITHIPPLDREPYPARGMNFGESDWGKFCFGQTGIPAYYGDMHAHGIHLLAGHQVDYYTDEELRAMLSEAALIDGPAAVRLTSRGFADLLGVKADFPDTEKRGSDSFAASGYAVKGNSEASNLVRGLHLTFSARDNTPFLTALDGAEILSEVRLSPYRGATPEPIMPGSTFFRNSRGGKVIVTALNVKDWTPMMVLNPGRKRQHLEYFKLLGGLAACLPAMQDAKLICGKLPDGSLLCIVFNYSYDPLELEIEVERMPGKIFELMPEGDFREVEFARKENRIVIPRSLEPAQYAILKLS